MTREECIEKIRHIQKSMYTFIFEDGKSYKFHADDADKFYYYLDMIVKYLDEDVPKEQEPCEDATLKDIFCMGCEYKEQEPKKGHWKERRNRATGHIETVCSECGAEEGYQYNDYCGNCGAKMIEPQENETWNGIHTQITAPKGTFERLFNEAEDDNDI